MKYLLLFFVSFETFAYRPTVESLFRNNNNVEFENPTTRVGFSVRKQNETAGFYTTIAITENRSGNEMYQTFSSEEKAKKINKVQEIPQIETILNQPPEKALFYSLMGMLLRNNSEMIISTLKRKGFDVAFNKEMENKEKKVLLEKYRSFLEKKKLDPEYSDDLSPLNGKDPKEKSEIMALYNQSFYSDAEKAQMVKDGSYIYWKVIKDGFEALFHSATRRLHKISYTKDDNSIEISFLKYFKADGIHEIPKYVNIRLNDEIYVLEVKEYKEFQLNDFQKVKVANKALISESEIEVPSFFIQ